MQEQFITLETAKSLKTCDFEVKTEKFYCDNYEGLCSESEELLTTGINVIYDVNNEFGEGERYYAPTQSLLQKWLREEHQIHVHSKIEFVGTDEWEFSYKIKYLPRDKFEAKRRSHEFKEVYSYVESPSGYIGAWRTYEEALENGLLEALKSIN